MSSRSTYFSTSFKTSSVGPPTSTIVQITLGFSKPLTKSSIEEAISTLGTSLFSFLEGSGDLFQAITL